MAETDITGKNPDTVVSTILMPLPDQDFDPTESAIPWKVCTTRGWRVAFSTKHGNVAQPDQNKLKGPLPGLLSAEAKAKAAYRQMTQDPSFIGVTSSLAVLKSIWAAFSITVLDNGESHSSYLDLIDLQGNLIATYPLLQNADGITADIQNLLRGK